MADACAAQCTWLAVVTAVVACRSPRVVPPVPVAGPGPSQPSSHDAATVEVTATPPSDPVQAEDFRSLATRAYAALKAGRVDDARALVADRPADCIGDVGVTKRRDGGFIIYGGRIVLRLDARGAIESHAAEAGCVDYADEQVTVVDVDSHLPGGEDHSHVMTGAVAEPISLKGVDITVQTSSDWVVLANPDGDYLAWSRSTAKIARYTVPEDTALPTIEGPPEEPVVFPRVAGRYLVTPSATAITLHRPDGTNVIVRGCKGRLLATAPIPGGVALHVHNTGMSADSRLCIVNDKGVTRRVTALGHATCGLAEPAPCLWELVATSSRLLVFSGLRGGVVIVDAKTGGKLVYRGEPDSQFPAAYSSCGDAVCVDTATEHASDSGRLEPARGGVRYRSGRPATDAADALKAAWCSDGDLLLPCEP